VRRSLKRIEDPFMTPSPDPMTQLKALIEKYTVITFIPDIRNYRRISVPKEGSCIFRGCTEPITWEDARGENFLCEGHYRTMALWIDQARKGFTAGERSALFDQGLSSE
jgi:hypothetical protein